MAQMRPGEYLTGEGLAVGVGFTLLVGWRVGLAFLLMCCVPAFSCRWGWWCPADLWTAEVPADLPPAHPVGLSTAATPGALSRTPARWPDARVPGHRPRQHPVLYLER